MTSMTKSREKSSAWGDRSLRRGEYFNGGNLEWYSDEADHPGKSKSGPFNSQDDVREADIKALH
jgi:hypothetical protein